jgi:hypothetical protein
MTHKPKRGRPFGIYKYPDAFEREQRLAFYRMKAQAKHRGEEFLLSFEEFSTLWDGLWEQRGRKPDDYCMTRTDNTLPWHTSNVKIITRRFHNNQNGENIRDNSEKKPFDIWRMPNEDV